MGCLAVHASAGLALAATMPLLVVPAPVGSGAANLAAAPFLPRHKGLGGARALCCGTGALLLICCRRAVWQFLSSCPARMLSSGRRPAITIRNLTSPQATVQAVADRMGSPGGAARRTPKLSVYAAVTARGGT